MVTPNTIEFPASSFIKEAVACHNPKRIVLQKTRNGIGVRANHSTRKAQKLPRRNATKLGNQKKLFWAEFAGFFISEKRSVFFGEFFALFKAKACSEMAKIFNELIREWAEKRERLMAQQIEVDRAKEGCLADDFAFEMLRVDRPVEGACGNLYFYSNLWKLVSRRLFA